MNGKFFIGFAIGVVGASAFAYKEMTPARTLAPLGQAPAVSSTPVEPPAPAVSPSVPEAPTEPSNPPPVPNATPTPPADRASDPPAPPAETHPQVNVAAPPSNEVPEQEKRVSVRQPSDARRIPVAPYPAQRRQDSVEARSIELKTAPTLPIPEPPSAALPATAREDWHTVPRSDASAPPPPAAIEQRSAAGSFNSQPSTAQSNVLASLRPEAAPPTRAPAAAPSDPVLQASTVTLPAGTPISIRLGEKLSTRDNHAGDEFIAALDQPLVVDGFVIAERGERVEGRIAEAHTAGHIRGTPELSVEITSVRTSDGQVVAIHTSPYVRRDRRGSVGVAKIGGGAVIGAAVGAIAGAGVGAAIGAGVGSLAGAGTALVTRSKPLVIPVETLLTFRLDQPVTITEHRDQHFDQPVAQHLGEQRPNQ